MYAIYPNDNAGANASNEASLKYLVVHFTFAYFYKIKKKKFRRQYKNDHSQFVYLLFCDEYKWK